MAKEIKTISVLTSGGDAPGARRRCACHCSCRHQQGYHAMGIQRGYNGLINGRSLWK